MQSFAEAVQVAVGNAAVTAEMDRNMTFLEVCLQIKAVGRYLRLVIQTTVVVNAEAFSNKLRFVTCASAGYGKLGFSSEKSLLYQKRVGLDDDGEGFRQPFFESVGNMFS